MSPLTFSRYINPIAIRGADYVYRIYAFRQFPSEKRNSQNFQIQPAVQPFKDILIFLKNDLKQKETSYLSRSVYSISFFKCNVWHKINNIAQNSSDQKLLISENIFLLIDIFDNFPFSRTSFSKTLPNFFFDFSNLEWFTSNLEVPPF